MLLRFIVDFTPTKTTQVLKIYQGALPFEVSKKLRVFLKILYENFENNVFMNLLRNRRIITRQLRRPCVCS